ncbi:MAG: TIGR00730 family Rossman fold protein, partial [Anaerolineae bacterium]|nr:TIGR00730 family Rossman fold protein [Anaerolineae bacterium]NIN96123.1 TIGR00730 family Rossman fold protein [Anaerolineae bacterium]
DAFVALPGGFGTFEELFEILTWAQIGLHRQPVGVLNIHGYFDPLLELVDHAQQQGFLYVEHTDLLISEASPEALLDRLEAFQTPEGLERWVNR